MEQLQARTQLVRIRAELIAADLEAHDTAFPSLRSVDARVREVKLILSSIGATLLLDEMEKDADFGANSRRVRLEALANYCATALTFLDAGALGRKRQLVRGPSFHRLTVVMPGLEEVVQERWLEAQRCQHAKAYLAAVIIMGSILEGLLLARASLDAPAAFRAAAAPRARDGKNVALQDWKLSALIDVAVELRWLKSDRGSFSHALRQSRNVLHPWEHVSNAANFDEATCGTCWHVLNAAVQDLLVSI